MPKLGNTIVVGLVWIAGSVIMGIYGSKLANSSGFVGIVGWVISCAGFGFALMSFMHLFKMVSGIMKALKWQKEDPEGFEKAKSDYERVMKNVENENEN